MRTTFMTSTHNYRIIRSGWRRKSHHIPKWHQNKQAPIRFSHWMTTVAPATFPRAEQKPPRNTNGNTQMINDFFFRNAATVVPRSYHNRFSFKWEQWQLCTESTFQPFCYATTKPKLFRCSGTQVHNKLINACMYFIAIEEIKFPGAGCSASDCNSAPRSDIHTSRNYWALSGLERRAFGLECMANWDDIMTHQIVENFYALAHYYGEIYRMP